MTDPLMSDAELLKRLGAHPDLRSRMESLLLAVEDEAGELKKADAAEMRVIEEMRRTGQVVLQAWANRQVGKTSQEIRQAAGVWREGKKKLCWHTTFGDIGVMEPQYRKASKRIRPFAQSAQVGHRGCSRPLQRAVTDFGADLPFAQVMDKLVEHYGIVLGESTIRHITEGHAQLIFEAVQHASPCWPIQSGSSTVVIVETDGGMVPIVEPDTTGQDKRKGKKLLWKEAKICLAHPQGSKTLVYGGTLQGDVDTAGQQLLACATQAGFGRNTPIHAVGDGAQWIADQVEKQFGAQGSYLLDFYHVCEYLGAAATRIAGEAPARATWMDEQKERLKTQQADKVLQALQPHLEKADIADSDAPVRQCHRYLSHRLDQLNYQSALARGLPIGGDLEFADEATLSRALEGRIAL